jgi:hypothetical protein
LPPRPGVGGGSANSGVKKPSTTTTQRSTASLRPARKGSTSR